MPEHHESGGTVDREERANSDGRTGRGGPASRGRRVATAALGGALAVAGLRKRSLGGAAMALTGGWLAYRGVTGGGGPTQADSAPAGPGHREAETGAEAGPAEPSAATTAERTVTVGRSADDLYDYWRDPDELSRIMGSSAQVEPADGDRLRWTVTGPLDTSLTWETAVVEDRPGEVLRWKSTEGSAMTTEGSVRFRPAPADRGTEVTLTLRFDPPGGRFGRAAADLLGVVPETLADEALDRFRSLAEAGEIPTLERNPSARGSGDLV